MYDVFSMNCEIFCVIYEGNSTQVHQTIRAQYRMCSESALNSDYDNLVDSLLPEFHTVSQYYVFRFVFCN